MSKSNLTNKLCRTMLSNPLAQCFVDTRLPTAAIGLEVIQHFFR